MGSGFYIFYLDTQYFDIHRCTCSWRCILWGITSAKKLTIECYILHIYWKFAWPFVLCRESTKGKPYGISFKCWVNEQCVQFRRIYCKGLVSRKFWGLPFALKNNNGFFSPVSVVFHWFCWVFTIFFSRWNW